MVKLVDLLLAVGQLLAVFWGVLLGVLGFLYFMPVQRPNRKRNGDKV